MQPSERSPDAARSESTISATLKVISGPRTRFSAALPEQPERLDRDAPVERLGHIVDRQRRYGGGDHGFQLDARPSGSARLHLDVQCTVAAPLEAHVNAAERQRMR